MITGHEQLKRLESIFAKGSSDPRTALDNKNAILRWFIDVSQYEQRKAEDLDAAALAALATLPSTPLVASSILRIDRLDTWLSDWPARRTGAAGERRSRSPAGRPRTDAHTSA